MDLLSVLNKIKKILKTEQVATPITVDDVDKLSLDVLTKRMSANC